MSLKTRIDKIEKIIIKPDEGIELDELCLTDFLDVNLFLKGKQEFHRLNKNAQKIALLCKKDNSLMDKLFKEWMLYSENKKRT